MLVTGAGIWADRHSSFGQGQPQNRETVLSPRLLPISGSLAHPYLPLCLGPAQCLTQALVCERGWHGPDLACAVPKPEPPQAQRPDRTLLLPDPPAIWSPSQLAFRRVWQQWVRIVLETPVPKHKTLS